jgi:ribosomal protein L10
MSKYVKNLLTEDLRKRLDGVNDLLLINVSALDANLNFKLRKDLRAKRISVLMVKNSLARRATEGTVLAPAFEGLTGSTAVVYGSEDIISLAKEITRLTKEKEYAKLESRGGVMDGARLSPEQVEQVSKWPSRTEQLSILLGQILSPGATLVGQLTAASGALASQIQQQGEEKEGEPQGEAPAPSEA